MKQNSFLIWLLYLMRFCKWLHFIHKFWYFHFQQRLRAISNICSFLVPNITCSQWRFQGFGQFWWRSLGLFFIVSLWVALSEEEIFSLMTWVGMMNLWLTSEILPLLSVLFFWPLWPLAHTFHLASVASQDHSFVVVKCKWWKGKWKGYTPFKSTMQHCSSLVHVHFKKFDT